MKYKFKNWVATTEMAEVMKIIKYHERKNGEMVVDEEVFIIHPELKDYFEPVKD